MKKYDHFNLVYAMGCTIILSCAVECGIILDYVDKKIILVEDDRCGWTESEMDPVVL